MLKFNLIVISLVLSASFGSAQQESNIAVVDIKTVFNHYIKKEHVILELKQKKELYSNEIKQHEQQIKQLENQLNSKKSTLNEALFRNELVHIELKKEELNKLIDQRNQELKQLEEALKKPILKHIYLVIEKIREEKGYEIVLNKKNVLAFNSQIDLTEDIIKELNKTIDKKN